MYEGSKNACVKSSLFPRKKYSQDSIWISIILLYIHVLYFLYLFICWWALELFPYFDYCKCYDEYTHTHTHTHTQVNTTNQTNIKAKIQRTDQGLPKGKGFGEEQNDKGNQLYGCRWKLNFWW